MTREFHNRILQVMLLRVMKVIKHCHQTEEVKEDVLGSQTYVFFVGRAGGGDNKEK
jgi:hypothetical protein